MSDKVNRVLGKNEPPFVIELARKMIAAEAPQTPGAEATDPNHGGGGSDAS